MRIQLKFVLPLLVLFSMIVPVSAEEYPYQVEEPPAITSSNAWLIDIDNGQLIWSFNGEDEIYPASMTKIMAAVLALEALPDMEERVTITDEMWAGLVEADASVAGFWPGDAPTVKELLYGVLLPSGADAVNALAFRISGSIPSFVEAMNRKAAELGMEHTHFVTPTGLHHDDHVSSPKDIAVLMAYALENETFAEILTARSYTTGPLASAPEGLTIYSSTLPFINNGEDSYTITGYLGGKSGFTPQAGRCLASHARQDDMHMVLVTSGSSDLGHIQDAAAIYNWYFAKYSRQTLVTEGSVLKEVTVMDAWDNPTLSVTAPSTRSMDLPTDAVIEVTADLPDELQAPIEANQAIGTLKITVNGLLVQEETLYAKSDYQYSGLMHMRNGIHAFHQNHPILFWIPVVLLVLVLCYLFLWIRYQIRRAQRRRRRARRKQQANRKTRS